MAAGAETQLAAEDTPASSSTLPAMPLLGEMRAAKLAPDDISYRVGLWACENDERWQLAMPRLSVMRAAKLAPDVVSYRVGLWACENDERWQLAMPRLGVSSYGSVSSIIRSLRARMARTTCSKPTSSVPLKRGLSPKRPLPGTRQSLEQSPSWMSLGHPHSGHSSYDKNSSIVPHMIMPSDGATVGSIADDSYHQASRGRGHCVMSLASVARQWPLRTELSHNHSYGGGGGRRGGG